MAPRTLPPEVFSHIFSYFAPEPRFLWEMIPAESDNDSVNTAALRALCLTSKHISVLATPFLYRIVSTVSEYKHPANKSSQQLYTTLQGPASGWLAPLLRRLKLYDADPISFGNLIGLLPSFVALSHLDVEFDVSCFRFHEADTVAPCFEEMSTSLCKLPNLVGLCIGSLRISSSKSPNAVAFQSSLQVCPTYTFSLYEIWYTRDHLRRSRWFSPSLAI